MLISCNITSCPRLKLFLSFQHGWINVTLNHLGAARRLRWFWQQAKRITGKATNMIISPPNVIELSWGIEHVRLNVLLMQDRKVSQGCVFGINQDPVSVANTVLHYFNRTFKLHFNLCHLIHLCCWRAVRALLRVFLNTSSNLFLNSINKNYSTSYLFGYALSNQPLEKERLRLLPIWIFSWSNGFSSKHKFTFKNF